MTTRNDFANPFRRALAGKKVLTGIWSMLNSTNAIEGLGWAGFDWLVIDAEHSPVSLHDAMAHLRALGATPTIPVVRLPWNDNVLIKHYLDIGAQTIMLPLIQNAREAQAAVRAMRYPPGGMRGFAAMHRASRYGHIPQYVERAEETLFMIVQVETVEALDRLDEIASVEGVDAVFFGPGDLSASMGLLGKPGQTEVFDRIVEASKTVQRLGKSTGVLAPSIGHAKSYCSAGVNFVSVATDCALLFRNADALAADFAAFTAAAT
ncbi:aldolase/citrate lyase family protein [Paracoccus onubensis]|uniref:HpcH/HpaI aldolase family protein n=1 Tax=Paracoccus onubensis TaxID=1675788 RepID=UPI00272F116D|nr:aldolase/citrate lyase family protein [Paracoccus onubensis]MDP0926278.1 aldolase/citrate lyase family protein [Paracoccus onubensis]